MHGRVGWPHTKFCNEPLDQPNPAPADQLSCTVHLQPKSNTPAFHFQAIPKTLIGCFRCVWLELEINCAGQSIGRSRVGHTCSRWCRLSIISFSLGHIWLVPAVSVANELTCLQIPSNTWLAIALAAQHTFRNPPSSPAPPV